MRYRFRGLTQDTGRPVEGHVEAPTEDIAYEVLAENGLYTESLKPDPRPASTSKAPHAKPEISDAIDSALDTSSHQVPFDNLVNKYKGKKVWVIDRDKIRSRVAQVVDQALQTSVQKAENTQETRQRVAIAIRDLFGENKNIASQAPATSVALEQQISRIERLVRQAEAVLAAVNVAARRVASGGGGGTPRRFAMEGSGGPDAGQAEVLLEIFKTNIELLQSMEGGGLDTTESTDGAGTADAAGAAPAAETPDGAIAIDAAPAPASATMVSTDTTAAAPAAAAPPPSDAPSPDRASTTG